MQDRATARTKGPETISARTKVTAADVGPPPASVPGAPKKFARYVFAERSVDIGRDMPIPAMSFHLIEDFTTWQYVVEIARRDRIPLITCPEGFIPPR